MNAYLLTIITVLPLFGALALLIIGRGEHPNENNLKWTTLIFSLATFVLSILVLIGFKAAGGLQFQANKEWIKAFDLGVRYHVGVDGLSLWLLLLTTFI